VEADKAWETSGFRKILIAVLTYLVMVLTMAVVLKSNRPFLDALIPTLGFLLSGLSLGVAKKVWVKYFYRG
jgi:hypothetical protein